MPHHYIGDLLHTIAISGRSRVRTELFQRAVVPASAPHPVQMHRQFPSHRYLGDLSSAAHGQMEESTAPLGLAAYRDLRRFHQQKPEQRIALLADVSQSPPIATGLLRRHQSHVAGHLLAAVETLGSPITNSKASAVSGPTPGCVIRRRVTGRVSTSASKA